MYFGYVFDCINNCIWILMSYEFYDFTIGAKISIDINEIGV